MIIDELLVVLGIKADDSGARRFADSLENVSQEAQNTERSMLGAYEATDSFVSAIEGFMGVLGFFTGVLGGAWAFFHSTITDIETLIEEEKLLTRVTKDQLEQSKKYNDSVEQLGKRYQSLKVELAFGFLPTMQRMIDAVDGFLASNKDLIVDGIGALLDIMTKTIQVFVNFVRFVDRIIEATVGWDVALGILAASLLWINRAMLIAFATNPITWIVAAIAALLLLIDDFMTYLDGGESQFGDFWGAMLKWIDKAVAYWDGFSDSVKSSIKSILIILAMLTPVLGGLTGMVSALGKAFLFVGRAMLTTPIGIIVTLVGLLIFAIFDLIKWIKTGESTFSGFWRLVADIWDKIVKTVSQRIELIVNAAKGMVSAIGSALGNVFDIVTAPFAKAFDWIVNKFSSLGGLISGAVSGARNLVGMGGAAAVSNTVNSGGNMTIHAPINVASNNPVAAGKAVQAGVTNASNVAFRNMNNRVKN